MLRVAAENEGRTARVAFDDPAKGWPTLLLAAALALGVACSHPARPHIEDSAAGPQTCAAAVARAFPGGQPGTLPAYRDVERRCASLDELSQHRAFRAEVLRIDCAPADILALGGEIPELGPRTPTAPADLIGTAVCRQFNQECADYDELRRDHATLARNPTMANLGLFVHHTALSEACTKRYG